MPSLRRKLSSVPGRTPLSSAGHPKALSAWLSRWVMAGSSVGTMARVRASSRANSAPTASTDIWEACAVDAAVEEGSGSSSSTPATPSPTVGGVSAAARTQARST